MKLVRLVLPSIAWTVAVASAHPAAPNVSALPIADSSLADHTQATGCFMPPSAVNTWWYNTRTDGPHHCYGPPYQTWAMLNSYRSGGTIDVHWKYTDNVFDQECLFGWLHRRRRASHGHGIGQDHSGGQHTELVRTARVP